MKYDVFISYSSKDQKVVEGICGYLESRGVRCFVAYRDIPRGVVWARAIVDALDESQMMVIAFTEDFNRSDQVDREIELAAEDRKPILTFRLADAQFRGAKKYYLKNLNWIDAFPNPTECFGELYSNVCKLLGSPVSEAPKTDPATVEMLSTEVIKEDLASALVDEFGVKYSTDGKRLLKGNDKLSEYTIRTGTKVICDKAFFYCKSLRSITIPNSVISIGDRAFYDCKYLRSITLPNSVISIGEGAFWSCYSLQNITLPDSITSIGDYTFEWCKSLQNITLPNSVTSIGDEAFSWCESLQSITFPNSVTSIGDEAFSFCKSLQSITISNSVTSIGDCALWRCESLQSITLPNSVTSIGKDAFLACSSLQNINISKGTRSKFEKLLPQCKDKLVEN